MSRKGPYLPWYPGDIQRDAALNSVSIGAFGLWHKLMYIAFDGDPYGHVSVKGRLIPPDNLARMVGLSLAEFEPLLAELEHADVFSRNEAGVIFSRRMVRDSQRSETAAANGKKGGNPVLRGPAPRLTSGLSSSDNQQLNQTSKGGVNPFPALCPLLSANASASENAGMGSGETRNRLNPPHTGEKFLAAWDAWMALNHERGTLYPDAATAQTAIDLLAQVDERYATELLTNARLGQWQNFWFNDTLSKYQRQQSPANPGAGRAGASHRSTPTQRSQATVQERGTLPQKLKDYVKEKNL